MPRPSSTGIRFTSTAASRLAGSRSTPSLLIGRGAIGTGHMQTKPEVLMIGPCPVWDMEDLDARYDVHKLWETTDRDHMIDANRTAIRAIATRGELGASADLM